MVNTIRKKTFDTTQLGSIHLLGKSLINNVTETSFEVMSDGVVNS